MVNSDLGPANKCRNDRNLVQIACKYWRDTAHAVPLQLGPFSARFSHDRDVIAASDIRLDAAMEQVV